MSNCILLRGRSERRREEIEQLGRKCSLLQFDVTDRAVVREQIEEDMKSNGAYYGVVSNAGIAQDGPFPGLTGEAWDSVINTNLHSFYNGEID